MMEIEMRHRFISISFVCSFFFLCLFFGIVSALDYVRSYSYCFIFIMELKFIFLAFYYFVGIIPSLFLYFSFFFSLLRKELNLANIFYFISTR